MTDIETHELLVGPSAPQPREEPRGRALPTDRQAQMEFNQF
jgi:hypothetical protein